MEELAEVRIGGQEPVPRVDLSKREREVLERLARGASNEQIAEELGIVPQTVRNYISTIYDKLGVHSRGEAIIWARERGII
jgi:DNA-binding NarL/FixJ family response regulator